MVDEPIFRPLSSFRAVIPSKCILKSRRWTRSCGGYHLFPFPFPSSPPSSLSWGLPTLLLFQGLPWSHFSSWHSGLLVRTQGTLVSPPEGSARAEGKEGEAWRAMWCPPQQKSDVPLRACLSSRRACPRKLASPTLFGGPQRRARPTPAESLSHPCQAPCWSHVFAAWASNSRRAQPAVSFPILRSPFPIGPILQN